MAQQNINKMIIIGHLGQNPELRYTAKGNAVTNLSVATNRTTVSNDGSKKEETQWHKATIWGKNAENCAKYLEKGSRIYIEGELQVKNWTDKEGLIRKNAEIIVSEILFLGGNKNKSSTQELSLEKETSN